MTGADAGRLSRAAYPTRFIYLWFGDACMRACEQVLHRPLCFRVGLEGFQPIDAFLASGNGLFDPVRPLCILQSGERESFEVTAVIVRWCRALPCPCLEGRARENFAQSEPFGSCVMPMDGGLPGGL